MGQSIGRESFLRPRAGERPAYSAGAVNLFVGLQMSQGVPRGTRARGSFVDGWIDGGLLRLMGSFCPFDWKFWPISRVKMGLAGLVVIIPMRSCINSDVIMRDNIFLMPEYWSPV